MAPHVYYVTADSGVLTGVYTMLRTNKNRSLLFFVHASIFLAQLRGLNGIQLKQQEA